MIHLLPIARIVSRPWSKAHLRILYFHGIEKPFIDQFQKHLDHFSQFFRWISLSEAVRALEKGDLCVPSAVITFDDADRSVYENGLPVLSERKIPCCIFAVPQYLDLGKTFREKTPRSVMSWQELAECCNEGAEIGNHTFSHANLARCSEGAVRDEVMKGKSVLEDRLGIPIVYFAYPYGQFTQKTRQIIRTLGCCQIQATTQRGQMFVGHDLHCLRRDRVDIERTPEEVECLLRLADRLYWLRRVKRAFAGMLRNARS